MHPRTLLAGLVAILLPLTGCTSTPADVQLQWSEHPELGKILADADGFTLYIFDNDQGGESSCYDSCADNWPPLLTEGDPASDDAVTGTLGTTERDDGSMQVTYDGDPLYYFVQDEEAGQANGQGIGDVWWVVEQP